MSEILEDAKSLVVRIREYSVEQASLWQQIPSLVLNAEGRTGFSEDYRLSYKWGYWAIDGSRSNTGQYARVFVDLDSGELVNYNSAYDTNAEHGLAQDVEVLKLAMHIDELDAHAIIRMLKQEAEQPYLSYYKAEEQDTWRESVREELGLGVIFTRP